MLSCLGTGQSQLRGHSHCSNKSNDGGMASYPVKWNKCGLSDSPSERVAFEAVFQTERGLSTVLVSPSQGVARVPVSLRGGVVSLSVSCNRGGVATILVSYTEGGRGVASVPVTQNQEICELVKCQSKWRGRGLWSVERGVAHVLVNLTGRCGLFNHAKGLCNHKSHASLTLKPSSKWSLHSTQSHHVKPLLFFKSSVILLTAELQSWGVSWPSPAADKMMITEVIKQACGPNHCLQSTSSQLWRTDQRELSRLQRKWHGEHWSCNHQVLPAGSPETSLLNISFSHTHYAGFLLKKMHKCKHSFDSISSILMTIMKTTETSTPTHTQHKTYDYEEVRWCKFPAFCSGKCVLWCKTHLCVFLRCWPALVYLLRHLYPPAAADSQLAWERCLEQENSSETKWWLISC